MPSALTLIGLNFGFLIGLITGLLSFIPYVGALTGFLVAGVVAVAQFWPDWTPIADGGSACSLSARSSRAMCCRPTWSAPRSACIRSG